MIDIVIPTLMAIDKSAIEYSILQACLNIEISHIIIIDNSGGKFKEKVNIEHNKIQVYEMDSNIYVNPAWNLGVSKCSSENILIMNDDIFCHLDVLYQVALLMNDNRVGLCSVETINCTKIEEYLNYVPSFNKNLTTNNKFKNPNNNKTGWFFCLKKKYWKNLPEDMKIWYGDDLIYNKIRKLGYETKNITSSKIGHFESATLKTTPNLHQIIHKDGVLYTTRYINEF